MDDIAVVPTLVILCVCECPPPPFISSFTLLDSMPPTPHPQPFCLYNGLWPMYNKQFEFESSVSVCLSVCLSVSLIQPSWLNRHKKPSPLPPNPSTSFSVAKVMNS